MGGDKYQTQEIRYAPYIEDAHKDYLDFVVARRNAMLDPNFSSAYLPPGSDPYKDYVDFSMDVMFLGSVALGSYPCLYDMYGKFLAGLDVEVLFDENLAETIDGRVVNDMISSEADILSDDLELDAYPRFETGMRDINAVMSSSFVVGRALMESGKTKALSRFSADIRGKLMPIAAQRWSTHLEWNRAVVEMYAQVVKLYISAKMDITNLNFEIHAKSALWPYTILEYNRAAVGVLQGATNTKTEVAGASTAGKAIGGAMMGAAGGAITGSAIGGSVMGMAAGPFGAIVGALVGLAYGLLS